jgi:hypothetical protein
MQLKSITTGVMIFSFISIIFIFIAALQIGVYNDYILYSVQDAADVMYYNQSMLTNNSYNFISDSGTRFSSFNFYLDELWLFCYLAFFVSSLVSAYMSEKENYFTFLGMLFYGTMAILFLLGLFTTLTDWFKVEILLKILPYTVIAMPKFYFYLDHVGLFSLGQLVICMIINMVDFDFVKIIFRKKQENKAFEDNEIV